MTLMHRILLDFTTGKLDQLTSRITDCLGRLNYEQVWARPSDNQNAIGNIVLHLCGNVRQWMIAGLGGKPDVRDRDAEFAARGGLEPAELSERIRGIVGEANGVIGGLTPERLVEHVTIQGYHLTVLEAVVHVVEHFSQHTGQIIYATKLITDQDLGYYAHLKRAAHSEKTP